MSIGQRIARERRNLNLTQEQLSEKLGVSRQTVSKWEQDIILVGTNKLIELCDILEVSIDYLLTGEEKNNKIEVKNGENGFEIDWTKVYPVLSTYQDEVDMDYYLAHFENMIKEAMKKYDYSLEDAVLVLKDVFYKAFLNIEKKKRTVKQSFFIHHILE